MVTNGTQTSAVWVRGKERVIPKNTKVIITRDFQARNRYYKTTIKLKITR